MPRDYLNQRERELFGITFAMFESVKEYIEQNEKWMGAAEKKYLRSSCTWYEKFMEQLFARVGVEMGRRMVRDFKGTKVYFDHPNMKRPDVIQLDTESVQDLAEGIITWHCARCRDSRQPDCSIREILILASTPPYDENGTCPYYPG